MTLMIKKYWVSFCVALFAVTRIFIWTHGPIEFSEIIYSYMPYAHLWASGVQPYRDQWFEYPPATIPLFYLPHIIDQQTHGPAQANWYHINYSQAYRGQILLIECLLFLLLLKINQKSTAPVSAKFVNLLFYILITTKANHFLYDTMDIVFAATITLSAVAPLLWKNPTTASAWRWLGFWLAAALKLMNLPLMLVHLAFYRPLRLKHLMIAAGMAAVVWAVPVAMYRSALQVIVVYHQQRGVQVDSVPGVMLRLASRLTKSEKIIEVYKNYEVAGPLTTQALPWLSLLQFGCLAVFGLWAGWVMWQRKNHRDQLLVTLTYGYVLLVLLVGKVQSTPFLLWIPPLAAVMSWPTARAQIFNLGILSLIISISMILVPNTELGIFTLPLVVGLVRSLGLGILFTAWLKQEFVTSRIATPSPAKQPDRLVE